MIRAAAKNFKDTTVICDKKDYVHIADRLRENNGFISLDTRKTLAAKAFDVCAGYDIAISNYFNGTHFNNPFGVHKQSLRYGENPHQEAFFAGNTDTLFIQKHGKELSYNNLVDVNAALQLMSEFPVDRGITFAIIKHTNVCGIAQREDILDAFNDALAGDPESAFGGVLITNGKIDEATADALKNLFFEVLIAVDFEDVALESLKSKKNRILLKLLGYPDQTTQTKSLLNGVLVQQEDAGNFSDWKEAGARMSTDEERSDLIFANLVCKHLKSNAIAIVKNLQLIGKGCGQTSRVDAMRQAISKAKQFDLDLQGAVVASDAFFPFDDCVRIGHDAGITAFIQPGGSIRDKDSIEYCQANDLVMVLTGMRHFRH